MLLKQRIEQAKLIGKWKDRWVFHTPGHDERTRKGTVSSD